MSPHVEPVGSLFRRQAQPYLPTITGFEENQVIVNANNQCRVFKIDDNDDQSQITVVIDGVTVTGGSATGGGGIYNKENLTISNSTINGNTAYDGGGILNSYSTANITNSIISRHLQKLCSSYGRIRLSDSCIGDVY